MHTHEWLDCIAIWKYRAYRLGNYPLLHSLIRAEAELTYTASFDSYR